MNKILTIIIPTYNMEKYLRRCLDSLIIDEEGMKQLEVLVINDGSKDSSSQIAHEYQDKYPDTYRVIDKENGNYGNKKQDCHAGLGRHGLCARRSTAEYGRRGNRRAVLHIGQRTKIQRVPQHEHSGLP